MIVNRVLAAGGVAALCLALLGAAPQAQFVELFTAATQAHDAKDYPAMEQKLRQALELRPAHPAALYKLAAALALRGESKDALKTLESLVEMGLSYEPSADPDFASLKNSGRFADVNKDFARNRKPAGRARTVLQMSDVPSYIPAGLAYDEDSQSYFIGSVHQRRIERLQRAGEHQNFVLPGAGSLWAPLGMVADTDRHLLWVASAAIPEMDESDPKELGRSAILAYDLRSGDRKRRFLLEDGAPEHRLGDVALARNGTIYTTDSRTGVLYEVDTSSGKFTALTQPGQLASPRGLVQGRDRSLLFVADYTQGLFRYDLHSHTLRRLDVSRDICVYGIDGLYRYNDDLVAVQGGVQPPRVVQFEVDRSGRRVSRARVLASGLPWFEQPALGVVIGDHFDFIANSQWDRYNEQHQLPPRDQLRGPLVLRVELEDLARRNRTDDRRQDATPAQPRQGLPLGPQLPCLPPACR